MRTRRARRGRRCTCSIISSVILIPTWACFPPCPPPAVPGGGATFPECRKATVRAPRWKREKSKKGHLRSTGTYSFTIKKPRNSRILDRCAGSAFYSLTRGRVRPPRAFLAPAAPASRGPPRPAGDVLVECRVSVRVGVRGRVRVSVRLGVRDRVRVS